MAEISVQPNIRDGGLSALVKAPTISAMPRRGPHRKNAPRAPRKAARSYLKAWRVYRDMTVEELADAAGMSTGNVSAIENQRQGYSPESLEALADALKIDTATLLSVDPEGASSIWPLWNVATPVQREQLAAIAKTLIKPGR